MAKSSVLNIGFNTDLDSTDNWIISSITKGFSSSYAIWRSMKDEAKVKPDAKVLAYKNIYQRTIELAKSGYIEEISIEGRNMHSRRDYKVTGKGIGQLLLHTELYVKDIETILLYMAKINLDIKYFLQPLTDVSESVQRGISLGTKWSHRPLFGSDQDTKVSLPTSTPTQQSRSHHKSKTSHRK